MQHAGENPLYYLWYVYIVLALSVQDETLVHCSITVLDKYDFSFQVSLGEDVYDVSAYTYICTYMHVWMYVCLC